MHQSITSTLVVGLLSSLTTALTITSPTSSTILTPSNFTVTWTSESSDPSNVNIDIVQTGNSAGLSRQIGSNVTVSDLSLTLTTVQFNAISDMTNGGGWQITINSVASEGNAFVAQSQDFTIAGVGGNVPTTTATGPTYSQSSTTLDASDSSKFATYSVNSSAFALITAGGSTSIITTATTPLTSLTASGSGSGSSVSSSPSYSSSSVSAVAGGSASASSASSSSSTASAGAATGSTRSSSSSETTTSHSSGFSSSATLTTSSASSASSSSSSALATFTGGAAIIPAPAVFAPGGSNIGVAGFFGAVVASFALI